MARDSRKIDNRWAVKARDVIRRHALRLGYSKGDLIDRYGWEPARLAHDAEYQYDNGCNYCGYPYRDMGHGLYDITLDIQDRDKSPYYRTNTKWCCQTCNRKKGTMTPDAFEQDRQVYETWKRQREVLERDPQQAGVLF
jgi:5-methylcytosine-specific restriction endonuclease McrA